MTSQHALTRRCLVWNTWGNVVSVIATLLSLLLIPRFVRAGALALPSPAQVAWADLEHGQFVHANHPPDLGKMTLDKFDPYRVADCAIAQGATYVIIVAKHGDGFCWWPTATTANSIKSAKWKNGAGDVFGEVVTACRSRGLAVGFYLSPVDQSFGAGAGGISTDRARQEEFNNFYCTQLTELCSNYGPQAEIWFDGGLYPALGERAAKIVAKLQPSACTFDGLHNTLRGIGTEVGDPPAVGWNAISKPAHEMMLAGKGYPTSRDGDPAGVYWAPLESDTTLNAEWFGGPPRPLDALLNCYYHSVGQGTQFVLNISPAADGSISQADFQRAGELGAAIKSAVGYPLAMIHGTGPDLTLDLKAPTEIDHVIIEEEIASGERIRQYVIEALNAEGWHTLAEGTGVGHKRIHRIKPVVVSQVRLKITNSVEAPRLHRFYVTRTGFNPRDPAHLDPNALAHDELPDGPTNLAFVGNGAKPAIASSAYPLEKHRAIGLNDGKYGNDHSWIPNAPNAWFQIELAKTATIGRFKMGRDREGGLGDRPLREIRIEVSTDGHTWRDALPKTDLSAVPGYVPNDTLEIQIPPIEARLVRVWVNPGECCLDEFEIYAPYSKPAARLPDVRMLGRDDN